MCSCLWSLSFVVVLLIIVDVALVVVVFVVAALVVDNDIVFRVIWIRLYGLAILEARALLDVRKLSALDQSEL